MNKVLPMHKHKLKTFIKRDVFLEYLVLGLFLIGVLNPYHSFEESLVWHVYNKDWSRRINLRDRTQQLLVEPVEQLV